MQHLLDALWPFLQIQSHSAAASCEPFFDAFVPKQSIRRGLYHFTTGHDAHLPHTGMSDAFETAAAAARQAVLDKLPRSTIVQSSRELDTTADVTTLPRSSGLMTERQLHLTELDCTDLLALISTGQATSHEVMLAYGIRASIAHQAVSSGQLRREPNWLYLARSSVTLTDHLSDRYLSR